MTTKRAEAERSAAEFLNEMLIAVSRGEIATTTSSERAMVRRLEGAAAALAAAGRTPLR